MTELDNTQEPAVDSGESSESNLKNFLLTLPQPIAVFGSGLLVASAAVYEWTDRSALTGVLVVLPIPMLLLLERLFPKREDWKLNRHNFLIDAFWVLTVAFIWVPLFDTYWETPISRGFEWLSEASAWPYQLHADSMLGLMAAAIFAMVVKEFI